MANQKPQINLDTKMPWCDSYEPGHRVHFIQARIKHSEPRYDAKLEFLDDKRIRVSWLEEQQIFQHHNVEGIKAAFENRVMEYVKFVPTANLLYIQTEEPDGLHAGVFSISYLAGGELKGCYQDLSCRDASNHKSG